MTLPNKEAGLATIGLEFAFTNNGSIPGAIGRTQDTVTEILKAQMQGSEGWNSAHLAGYAGLPEGVPLVLGLLMKIVEQITGLPIIEWGEATLDIIDDVFGAIGTFFARMTSLFPSLDFMLDGDWDPLEMIQEWLTGDIIPLDLLLGPDSLLNAGNLFGFISDSLLGLIPVSHIGNDQPELLIAPTMDFIENIVGGGQWQWDAATGHTTNGCVKTTAASTERVLMSNPIQVTANQKLNLSVWSKWSGLTYTGTPIKLQVKRYLNYVPVGVQDIGSPTTPATNQATWVNFGDSDYQVPGDCDMIVVQLYVASTATAGTVFFDDASAKKVGLWSMDWTDGLPDLNSLTGLLRDIFAGIPTIPPDPVTQAVKDWWAGVGDTFGEMGDLFGGLDLEIPSNPITDAVSSFFSKFFRGGAENVVTQAQVAEASGVPPVDSDVKIPWVYLPPELMTVALGMPWVTVNKGSNQSIPATTDTLITGLSQSGPATLVISGNKFKFPFDGMWNIEIFVQWSAANSQSINLKQNDILIRTSPIDTSSAAVINTMIPASTADEFSLYGLTGTTMSVLAAGTFIQATYMGMTTVPSLPPPLDPVTFDAYGGADDGGDDTLSWSHIFGANSKTIVVPISQENPGTPTVTCGPYNVPILAGPTFIGNYFGANARGSFAAAILPDAVKGTTRTVTVEFPASLAGSANSMSFNGVGSLGTVVTSAGLSAPYLNVPSNVKSMVAMHFAGMDVAFSGFNRTQINNWGFSSFAHWAHLIGYAVGGAPFAATGGRWSGQGIELHP